MALSYQKSPKKIPSDLDLQFSFHRYRKLRLYFAWPLVLLVAIYARSSDHGFWVGLPVIGLGEAVRIWSHGYLRKARRLALSGPYAFVRNPLYMGNFLIGLGFCAIIWHPITAASFVVGFSIVYWVTVRGEEQRLTFKFGDEYLDYCQNVRRFLPRVKPYKGQGQKTRFKWHRVWGHGEQITILAVLVCILGLYARQEVFQNQAGFSLKIAVVTILVVVLASNILVLMVNRYSQKKKRPRLLGGFKQWD